MPLCEGRSNGPGHHEPCPEMRADASVRNRQGDLWLCDSCTEYRFPDSKRIQQPDMVATRSAKLRASNNSAPIKSTSSIKVTPTVPLTSSGCRGTVQNCTSADGSGSLADEISRYDRTDGTFCANCHEEIQSTNDCIQCVFCKNNYDQACSGLSFDVFDTMRTINLQAGWVCRQCRTNFNGMQSALSRANEEIADMRVSIAWLYEEITLLKNHQCHSSVGIPINDDLSHASQVRITSNNVLSDVRQVVDEPVGQSLATNNVTGDLKYEIHKTIHDINRRKCNVVISGLPECIDDSVSDEAIFTQFCEENLTVKPSLAKAGCRRLGRVRVPDGQPRRLLVHLKTEDSAVALLSSGRLLRQSSNPQVKAVYINPDLSPAEAKLAYENRQRRRERLNRRNVAVSDSNMDRYDRTESDDNQNLGTNANASATASASGVTIPSDVINVLAVDGGQSSSRNFQ